MPKMPPPSHLLRRHCPSFRVVEMEKMLSLYISWVLSSVLGSRCYDDVAVAELRVTF